MIDYLVEITAHNGSGVVTLRYSGAGANYGGNYYAPRLKNPGSLKLMMFADGTTKGQSKVGFGEVQLINVDGGLDALIDYGFDGRTIVIKELILATMTIGMTLGCSMEQPVWNDNEMSIRIKDPQIAFNVPLQTNKYAGSNVLPNGVEGTADIKGKPKPLAYGEVHNATPVIVNTSKLIFQGHDGALQSIPAVYDKGVVLTLGTAHATQAAMEAATPLPATYDTWLAGGCFRLGSSAFGAVTCDMLQGATAADRTAAQIGKQIALRTSPVISYVAQDFVDLDALNSAVIGYFTSSETTIAAALDEVIGSIGGWYGFDSANLMNVGRLEAPSGSPVATLTSDEITDIQRLATQDEGRGLPVWKVNVNYDKNNTVQTADSSAGIVNTQWMQQTLPMSTLWLSVTYGNGTFVAISTNTTVAASSPDGITWTQRVLPANVGWTGVTYGNGTFVAISAGTVAATSPDGITWTQQTLPAGVSWTGVAYGNGVFVTVAGSSTVAATSPDGITWTQRVLPVNANWKSVTYGNGVFVTVAYTTIAATSPDGITWTQQTLPVTASWYSVSYGNNLFVTVGYNTAFAATSPDGITWTQRVLPLLNRYSVAYGNGAFVTVPYSSSTAFVYRVTLDSLRLGYVTNPYRTVTDSDASILTVHPLAAELNLDTLISYPGPANTEATRQLTLRKVRRDYIAVTIKRSALAAIPDLGRIINVTYPRYGYNAGKLFVMFGYDLNLSTDSLTLYLWG